MEFSSFLLAYVLQKQISGGVPATVSSQPDKSPLEASLSSLESNQGCVTIICAAHVVFKTTLINAAQDNHISLQPLSKSRTLLHLDSVF